MKNRLYGMTLVETLIYIGLFAIIIVMVVNFMITTLQSSTRISRNGLLDQNMSFLANHMEDTFDRALEINSTGSIFENNNSVLNIQLPSGPQSYLLNEGTLFYNGARLTPPSVRISRFFVSPVYDGAMNILAVRVQIQSENSSDSSIHDELNILLTLR